MSYFFSLVLALIGGAIGAILVILYNSQISHRQEKALLILFAQEYKNLFSRSSMYYDQMLRGRISTSTLCQVSDAATLTKFAEITKNCGILEKLIDLRTWFFQVVRMADTASEHLASGNNRKARERQERAMAFFMGDPVTASGNFDRRRYTSYLTNIRAVVDYLEHVNEPKGFRVLTVNLIDSEEEHTRSIMQFCHRARAKLVEIESELVKLREQEEQLVLKSMGSSEG